MKKQIIWSCIHCGQKLLGENTDAVVFCPKCAGPNIDTLKNKNAKAYKHKKRRELTK